MTPAAWIIMPIALLCLLLGLRGPGPTLTRLRKLMEHEPSVPAAQGIDHLLPAFVVRNLRRLGVTPTARDVVAAMIAFLLPVLLAAIFLNLLAAMGLAAAMALAGYAALNILAARRTTRLAAMMPGFFDRVRQLLAVGNSLSVAFTRAVQSAQPELAEFFAPTLRRIGNGAGLAESIQQSTEDIELVEMRLFAAAIATNMRFGGPLTQALGNLVTHLRKRAAMARELRADTAQIRASAWVLGLLPLLVAGLIIAQSRDYAHWFLSHSAGHKMLAYCVVSQAIGALLMRRIVRMAF